MADERCTVSFAPSAERPPNAPTMKYWNSRFPCSLPFDLYLPKSGMTVVSCSPRVPRWKGEVNWASEDEASVPAFRRWRAAAEDRTAGSWWREAWRTSWVAAREERAIVGGGWCGSMGGSAVQERW